MTSPLNAAGPQKTFWNTYAFNPFVAESGPSKAGYLGLSILMFVVAPFWAHGLLYFFVRMPFKAKQKEFMNEAQASQARAVDRAIAATDPLRRAESDSTYKTLLEKERAIIAKNKKLHDDLRNLKKNSSIERAAEDNATQAKISDAIMENMIQLGDISRQIAEYERTPSPLSSLGLPSSKDDSPPGVNSAPKTSE